MVVTALYWCQFTRYQAIRKHHADFNVSTIQKSQVIAFHYRSQQTIEHRGSFDHFFVVGSHRDQSCHLWMQVFAPVTLHNGLTFTVKYEQIMFCDWFRDRQGIIWQEWILWCFCDKTGLDVKIWPPWSWYESHGRHVFVNVATYH